jgi:predicted metal-binding protein
MANAELAYALSARLSANVAARYAGGTLDRAGGVGLGDYWLVDLRAQWQASPAIAFFARAENLLDKQYQTASGYGALGRSVYAGLRGISDAARRRRAPCVVVCNTCRHSADQREDDKGQRGGAALAAALRRVRGESPHLADVAVEEMPCLFACQRHCVVHIRAPGRIGYVLGGFAPDADAAAAILDFAARHAQSDHGQVPYAQWHAGVKGHFIVRTPPEGFVVA